MRRTWKKRELPELLAPAGSWDALQAAVGSGADAVYLAGTKFGARAYADNFDTSQLIAAVEYAHRVDVRVYVTVNTLLADKEFEEAGNFLLFLYEQGVDGVLVQDPGLIHYSQKNIPSLPLHASTQLTLHNSAGVRWAADVGLCRVVLARELGEVEIQHIVNRISGHGIGLEIFIHGALCYSYSGQCMLSSVIGGRSGNRGRCAQPCRKPYLLTQGSLDPYDRIIDPQTVSTPSYCLSTRDLSTYLHLDKILRLPVDALKIEGRMKSPQYVATVVRIYRNAMDEIAAGNWTPRDKDVQDLLLAFNRGFTGGHLFGEPVMGATRSDHQGMRVGKVLDYETAKHSMKILLSGNALPEKGDGIYLLSEDGKERGMRVMQSPVRSGSFLYIFSPEVVKPDTMVFITDRASINRAAFEAMNRLYFRKIPVEMEVSWTDRKAIFEGIIHKRKKDLLFRYESSLLWEEARTHPLSAEQIVRQLQKSGNTPFDLHIRKISYPGGLFLPFSVLNTVRRDVLSFIGSHLVESCWPPPNTIVEVRNKISSRHPMIQASPPIKKPTLSTYVHTADGVQAAIDGGSDSICLEADIETITLSTGICMEKHIPLYWIWPRILHDEGLYEWVNALNRENIHDLAGLMVCGPGVAQEIKNRNSSLILRGSADLNVWNHYTVHAFTSLFHTLVLSPELSLSHIRDLMRMLPPEAPLIECIVQGNLEVMVSENCPEERMKSLNDRSYGLLDVRDRLFPARIDSDGRTHIYNAVETCYIDHLPALRDAGIASFAIEGRYRSPRYIREMVSIYREALHRMNDNAYNCFDLKEEIRQRARGGITLGPLMKGLMEE